MRHLRASVRFGVLFGSLSFGSACAGALAQANSEMTGLVSDQTGALVAGARIELTDPLTGYTRTAETNTAGLYVIGGLNPARYDLKVSASGFAVYHQTGIMVNVSSNVRVDTELKVGPDRKTVTVEANGLAVQADSNVLSSLISSDQISEIATENRNFAALVGLGLGVSSAVADNNVPDSTSDFNLSVNGLRQSHNIWLIDGGESDDRGGGGGMEIMPSQEAVAEFAVLGSNYPADYGISSGATISLSLKSGTRQFHGELFEFNRNMDYDANNYFNKLTTPATPRATIHYNIFGVNFGGPVIPLHAHASGGAKTFFFWSEEWRKLTNSAGSNEENTIDPEDIPKVGQNLSYVAPGFDPGAFVLVPNVAASSSYYQTRLKPLGLTPNRCWNGPTLLDGQGNVTGCQDPQVIPASLFDNNGVLYLNSPVFPKPNVSGQDKNISSVSNPIDIRDDLVRVDRKFSERWSIFGHFIHDSVTEGFGTSAAELAWASYNTITSTLMAPSYSAVVRLSGSIGPSLLIETSMNYGGNVIDIADSAAARLPSGWNVMPVSTAFTITRKALPGMGYMSPYEVAEDTGSVPYENAAQDYEPKIDVSFARGKHVMKYGFSYNRFIKTQPLFGDSQGFYTPSSTTNDSLMDILLGLTNSYFQYQATPVRHYVNQTPSGYAMDTWRATARLSLQLGLRYDALPHTWERNNAIGNFDPAAYSPSQIPIWTAAGTIDPASPSVSMVNSAAYYLNGMQLARERGVPRGLVENRYATLQPRVGFSFDLFGAGQTILRGGFGTFYERTEGNDIYGAALNPPFAYGVTIPDSYLSSPGTNWQTGQSAASQGLPVFVANLTTLAPHNFAPPGVAMYSLGLQSKLSRSVLWVLQYAGNAAWHQWDVRQINTIPTTVGNVPIPEPDGSIASVPVACLGGDPGNHSPFGDDSACSPGFQSFPGGMNQFLQFQGYGQIQQQEMATNGNYSGLQTSVRVQNRFGLSGEIDYTWSHEIDIESYDDNCCVSNPWNLRYDHGSGALDRRHILSVNYVYKSPLLRKGHALAHLLAGGWEIAGTVIAESGLVQTATGSGGIVGSGNTYDPVGLGGGYTVRPNITGKMTYPKKWGQWFDTSKFSNVIPFWQGGPNLGFGNSGKDAVTGPGRLNFTTSLYKSLALTRQMSFELRFESFNTFNHSEANTLNTTFAPQNGPFSSVLSVGNTFGQVTSTWDPRVLELGGKLIF